jgi:hypothetical protein
MSFEVYESMGGSLPNPQQTTTDPRILSAKAIRSLENLFYSGAEGEAGPDPQPLLDHIDALTEERDRLRERNAKLERVAEAAKRWQAARDDEYVPINEVLGAEYGLSKALAALDKTP